MANMLIIAPQSNEASRLTNLLINAGHKVVQVGSLRRGRTQLALRDPAITFCFHPLQEIDGPGCIAGLLTTNPEARIMIVCPFAQSKIAAEAISKGALDYLPMPLDPSEVAACTARTLHSGVTEKLDPVRFEASGGALIMTFPVKVSCATASNLNWLIAAGLVIPKNGLILDFTETAYLSSAGIGSLLLLGQKIHNHGSRPIITGVGAHIRKLLCLSGADTQFDFHHSIVHALSSLKTRT